MKSYKFALLLLVAASVTSCAVGPQGSYYQPSYPDGSAAAEGGACYGTAGPPSVIKFPAEDGTVIRARLDPDRHGRIHLRLLVDVPRGSSAHFAGDEIRVADPNAGKEWTIQPQNINLVQAPPSLFPSGATIDFDSMGPTTSEHVAQDVTWKDLQVWIPISIDNYHPRAVRMQLPSIVADEKEFDVPPIWIVEDVWTKEKNRIEAKGRRALWWWPYRGPEKEDGSWISVNDFVIGGGFTSGYSDSQFGGNIMVSFPPSVRWRFSSSTVRIVDIDTGEERHVSFDRIIPRFNLKASFVAPVLGHGSGMRTTASADLVVSEGPIESLVVTLPAVVINGKKFPIKPITFGSSAGFGLIPFNC